MARVGPPTSAGLPSTTRALPLSTAADDRPPRCASCIRRRTAVASVSLGSALSALPATLGSIRHGCHPTSSASAFGRDPVKFEAAYLRPLDLAIRRSRSIRSTARYVSGRRRRTRRIKRSRIFSSATSRGRRAGSSPGAPPLQRAGRRLLLGYRSNPLLSRGSSTSTCAGRLRLLTRLAVRTQTLACLASRMCTPTSPHEAVLSLYAGRGLREW